MPPHLTSSELSSTILAFRCQQETQRFWQERASDPRYCHELFRRALAEPHQESSKEAWQIIHRNYQRQVVIWVKGHPSFPATGEDPERLADLCLERMWLSFARSPAKYGRFPQSDPDQCLRALLRFLQTCVHSVVINHLPGRSEPLPETIPYYDPNPTAPEAFWNCIYQRLQDDREKLLVDAAFVYGLKPRHIHETYPTIFADVNEIYRLKENVLARFRRDASLSYCLELATDFRFDE